LSCWSELEYYSDPEFGCIKYLLCSASVLWLLLYLGWPGCSSLTVDRSSRLQYQQYTARWAVALSPDRTEHRWFSGSGTLSLERTSQTCSVCTILYCLVGVPYKMRWLYVRSLITYNSVVLGVVCVWPMLRNLG